jgi:hypothetical protein
MWGCEWRKQRKEKEVVDFLQHHTFKLKDPIGPDPVLPLLRQEEMLTLIRDKRVFGAVCVSGSFPESLRSGPRDQFPLIFKRQDISREDIPEGSYMRKYLDAHNFCQRPQQFLISSHFCRQLTMTTDYLVFLLEYGFQVEKIYTVLQWQKEAVFRGFVDQMTQGRADAKAAKNEELSLLYKLVVNRYVFERFIFIFRFEIVALCFQLLWIFSFLSRQRSYRGQVLRRKNHGETREKAKLPRGLPSRSR